MGRCYTSRKNTGKRYLVSYIVRARETLLRPLEEEKSSPVGFRESRREIALGLDHTAVTDLRG